MMNMFLSFNPMTSYPYSMNWLFMMTPLILIPKSLWMKKSPPMKMMNIMINNLHTQFKQSLNIMSTYNMTLYVSLMFSIMSLNMSSILPYTFPLTAHLTFNMSLSLSLWMSSIMKKMNNPKKLLASMNPLMTPPILIPFMVLIESISLMIQPITLAVRLTANITAGHIMLTLLTNLYSILMMWPLTIPAHMALTILELSVSMIQAYVFSLLVSMYTK